MTIGEFKAFVEGMDVSGKPTEKQWTRILEKVAELETLSLPSSPTRFDMPTTIPPYIPHTPDTNPYPYTTNPIITC